MAETERVPYDIIVSALEGDEKAINFIIAFHIPFMEAVVRDTAWWLSKESQEDSVQEICIKLMGNINKEAFTI